MRTTSFTGAPLVKWHRVDASRVPFIAARLETLRLRTPPGLPRLRSFGWAGEILRLEQERAPGFPLSDVLKTATPVCRVVIADSLRAHLGLWKEAGFVHGDLSPSNILVEAHPGGPRISFIDWIIDLESHEGTPIYASEEVRQGCHTLASDRYAMSRILCIVGS